MPLRRYPFAIIGALVAICILTIASCGQQNSTDKKSSSNAQQANREKTMEEASTQSSLRSSYRAKGGALSYVEQGQGDLVILLHGLMVTGDVNWRLNGIADRLAENFRVVTIDLKGHGHSAKPHDPKFYGKQLLTDISGLIDHLGASKAHLVGYSTGGEIVMAYLTEYPNRVISAVISGGGLVEEGDYKNKLWAHDVDRFGKLKPGELISTTIYPDIEFSPEIRALIDSNDPQALSALASGMLELSVTAEALAKNSVPALLVIGENDIFKPSADRALMVNPALDMIVIADRDHLSTLSAPSFSDAIDDFLRKTHQ